MAKAAKGISSGLVSDKRYNRCLHYWITFDPIFRLVRSRRKRSTMFKEAEVGVRCMTKQ